jgi:hypothetical protein
MTLAIVAFPGTPNRDAKKARAAQGEAAQQPHKREGASRRSHFQLESLRRLQASSNTYPTGSTPRQQRAALRRLSTTFYERKRGMRRTRSKRSDRKPVKDGTPVLDASTVELAAVLEQIAAMEALPRVHSMPSRTRRRRCAT